jgi:hypothetical protein
VTTSCRSGYRRGCKVFALRNWREVAILIEEADGGQNDRLDSPPGHSRHGHYRSARAFAVNPARRKARPLRARGLTAQRGRARGAVMPRMPENAPLLIRTGDNLVAERVVEWLQGTLLELDVAEIVVHEADEPNVIVDLLNAKRLTGERS